MYDNQRREGKADALSGRCGICGRRIGIKPGDGVIFHERTPWGVKRRYVCKRCNVTGAGGDELI